MFIQSVQKVILLVTQLFLHETPDNVDNALINEGILDITRITFHSNRHWFRLACSTFVMLMYVCLHKEISIT